MTVTLITGDKVTVSAGGTAFEPGPGRTAIRSLSWQADGHQYVVPTDAMPLVQQGRLDRRLFDVSTLRDFGYTGDKDLPLLLAYPKTGKSKGPAAARAAVGATARLGRDMSKVSMLAMRAGRPSRTKLWSALTTSAGTGRTLRTGVDKVYLDGKLQVSLDVSVPQIGAPAAWQQGLDGTGVTVAVLDTGIDATHPDLVGKVATSQNFTTEPSADDTYGHGTHIASTIVGSGAASGGKFKGVAPGAKLAIGKVCEGGWCDESAVLAGMQWAAPIAPVVSMSLGFSDDESVDPLEQAVNDLTDQYGTLFVIAAGNKGGWGEAGVDSPASADAALAVGAVDADDEHALFSSWGPRRGDGTIKPDITAPGVAVTAARAANATIGDPAPDGYSVMSGTSMATPHVAGAAAILTEQHPDWSPARRKAVLMGSANPNADSAYYQGAGRVDVARAVRQTISVDEPSVNFGAQAWPHDDDAPLTKTLTYRNDGTAPVSLALAVDGDTTTFTVPVSTLTVPAGGTATAEVVATTSNAGADGYRTGRVVATAAGDLRVETPLAVQRDLETHNVTISHIGRDGTPNLDHWAALIPLSENTGGTVQFWDYTAQETHSVPAGRYGMFSMVYGPEGTTMLVQTTLVVDADKTITMDAREAKPVGVTAPRADAKQAAASVAVQWTTDSGSIAGTSISSAAPGDMFTAQLGSTTSTPGFTSVVSSTFGRWKNDDEGFLDSPWSYETAYFRTGGFPTGFVKQITPAELATIKTRYARNARNATGVAAYTASLDSRTSVYGTGMPFTLPFERTTYVNTDSGVRWQSDLQEKVQSDPESFPEIHSVTSSAAQQYTAGQVYHQDGNTGVFAPSTTDGLSTRAKNEILIDVPLFSDGAGRQGRSWVMDTARTSLSAGSTSYGSAAADTTTFKVPAARQNYRLEMSAARSAPFTVSTSVTGVWTFSSQAGSSVLPLSSVQFNPTLSATNQAPAGTFTIPATVRRAAGSAAAPARSLTAEYSVDDGKTWKPAVVGGYGDQRTVRVTNPTGGYVSLRATTIDTAGNTATITVIRAYGTA
ncbi:S8 family serine peptidase [Actinoplanes sp. RD1]|uniref:S8 family serine peptidase n=1 Tax=Actinoplanes sp. RD1 TaxID=3064538 RepID=UPI00274108C5|nr:S8 family serine peptidase [Actinoplanes sp. RD1]